MWHIIRILESLDGNCGYEFSWSPFRLLPFSGSASYHNYHQFINFKLVPITLEILHHFLLFGIPFLEPMVNIMSINLKKKDKNKLEF